MEKYSRVLIYIFLLSILNLSVSSYLIYKVNNIQIAKTQQGAVSTTTKPSPTPVSSSKPMTSDDIRNDLTIIKAEVRALRDSLEGTGLIIPTPEP